MKSNELKRPQESLNRAFDSDMCVRTDNGAMSKMSPKGPS